MTEPVPQSELRAWCERNIALLEANVAEARRNQHHEQLRADYERELARWQAMRALVERQVAATAAAGELA